MTTTGAGSVHPLVEHLRGIQAGERDKRANVNEALTELRHELANVQRRVQEAERSLLAADVRLSAVSDTIRQAEEFLGVDPSSHPQADQGERPDTPRPESSGEPKPLERLIIEALADGLDTPASAIVSHAQLNRPGTTSRQITNCASRLQSKGEILIVGRGLYRLVIKESRT
ncbi:hypothetical protein [Streptomyces griseus]|uniref:hypothetical protein n=1 Tax=Streptomyces griseus TaxID=1911 RepID=UPI0036E2BD51